MKDLLEYAVSHTQMDRATGVLRNTVIINATSKNGPHAKRRYSERALKQIASMAEGLPAYANHVAPDLAFKARDVRDMIGRHKNVRYDATRQAVVSDLHVLEHQAPLVFGLAQGLGDIVGNSLVSRGATRMEGDVEVVDEVSAVRSADLVSDPATTKGLWESREARSETTQLDEAAVTYERLHCAVNGIAYVPPVPQDLYERLAGAV
jgi:hypothetical protein